MERYNVPTKQTDEQGNDHFKGQIAAGNADENTAKLANGDRVVVRDDNGNLIAGVIHHGKK